MEREEAKAVIKTAAKKLGLKVNFIKHGNTVGYAVNGEYYMHQRDKTALLDKVLRDAGYTIKYYSVGAYSHLLLNE